MLLQRTHKKPVVYYVKRQVINQVTQEESLSSPTMNERYRRGFEVMLCLCCDLIYMQIARVLTGHFLKDAFEAEQPPLFKTL